MHLGQVDLNLFVVLEAIYREGNITRAGHQLNLTQPAISHALKRLRELLRDPLFVRQGPHMVPTPFTRNMIDQVRQALQLLEVNLHESRSFVPEHARRSFHLSLWEYTEALILPSLMQRLANAAPGMTISTSRIKRRDLEAELARGAVDLAIEIPMTMSDRIRSKALLREPFVVMARKDHPAIKDKLDLDTYLAQRHVQVSSRRHGPSLVDIELSRRGLRREVSLRIQNNCAASIVVNRTDMLLTLPERQSRLVNLGSLNRVYPFPLPEPHLEAHLYWHESVENDPANRWLRGEIERSQAGKLRTLTSQAKVGTSSVQSRQRKNGVLDS